MIDKNLPNKLTMSRVIAIPIFIILYIFSLNKFYIINIGLNYSIDIYRLLAAIVFILASITDYFDGMLARKYNLISNFGKLMDPLADKMIVITALILLMESREVNFLCVLVVALREIIISSIRLIALEKNVVIAASMWGKLKTSSQMIAIIMILLNVYFINKTFYIVTYFIFYISTLFVIISLIDYIIKSKELLLT